MEDKDAAGRAHDSGLREEAKNTENRQAHEDYARRGGTGGCLIMLTSVLLFIAVAVMAFSAESLI